MSVLSLVGVLLAVGASMFAQSLVLLFFSPALFVKHDSATLASLAFAVVWLPALFLIPVSASLMKRFDPRHLYAAGEFAGAAAMVVAGVAFEASTSACFVVLFVRGCLSAAATTAVTVYVKNANDAARASKSMGALDTSRLLGSALAAVLGWILLDEIGFRTACFIGSAASALTGSVAMWWPPVSSVESAASSASDARGSVWKLFAPSFPMFMLLLATIPLQAYHHVARTPLAVEHLDLGLRGVAMIVLVNTVAVTSGAWFAWRANRLLLKAGHSAYFGFIAVSCGLLVLTPVARDPVLCMALYGAYLFAFQVCWTVVNGKMIADAAPDEVVVLVPLRLGILPAALLVVTPGLGVAADSGGLRLCALLAASGTLATAALAIVMVCRRAKRAGGS